MNPDATPSPDPTVLTTQQLETAVAALKEILQARMDGRDEAVDLQFVLVERQRIEQKADTKAAVDAALTAQKEAVREQTLASERAIAKSEAATTKQLEQLSTTFTTAIQGVTISLADLKERVGRIESLKAGGSAVYAGLAVALGLVIAAVGLAVSAILKS